MPASDELFDILKRNFGLVNKFDSKMSILFVEIDPAEKKRRKNISIKCYQSNLKKTVMFGSYQN